MVAGDKFRIGKAYLADTVAPIRADALPKQFAQSGLAGRGLDTRRRVDSIPRIIDAGEFAEGNPATLRHDCQAFGLPDVW